MTAPPPSSEGPKAPSRDEADAEVSSAPTVVGGAIRQPLKLKDQRPVYPAIAQSARIQGVVIIEATIGPDGSVQGTKVLRSIPLLDDAAIDAVRHWKDTPTLNER